MSNQNITTLALMEQLTDAGYRAHLVDQIDGKFVKIYDDSKLAGIVGVDKMYCLEVNANTDINYRKHLLDTLYEYATTPIKNRKEPLYKVGLARTCLYINHINEKEATVTANKITAKAYRMAEIDELRMIAKQNKIEIFIEDIDRVAD